MAVQDLLHLTREDIFAADDEHLLDATGDGEKPTLVHPPHVARTKVPIFIEDRSAVASGSLKYPAMTFPPRIRISPSGNRARASAGRPLRR